MSNVFVSGSDRQLCDFICLMRSSDVKTNYEFFVIILGRGGSAGGKFRISLGMPVGAVINCADNTGQSINRAFRCALCANSYRAIAELTWSVSNPFQVVRTCTLSLSMAFVVV